MNYYKERIEFIKKMAEVLSVTTDFGGVHYARESATAQEYIKVFNTLGNAYFINITSHDLETILFETMSVLMGQKPNSLIDKVEDKRRVARLFKVA